LAKLYDDFETKRDAAFQAALEEIKPRLIKLFQVKSSSAEPPPQT
jgi:hypothetical protein